MTGVSVHKVNPEESLSVVKEIETIYDQIRQRAFELFERRGCTLGKDMDDWLNAEAQFVFAPPSELIEGKKSFEIHVAAFGFTRDQLKVAALPDCVVVIVIGDDR